MDIQKVIDNANADSKRVGLFPALIAQVILVNGGRVQIVNTNESIVYFASNERLISIAKQDDGTPYWVQGWI